MSGDYTRFQVTSPDLGEARIFLGSPMTSRRTIAAAQVISVRGDVSANVQAHLQLVRAAAEQCAQVLVFPELSLTGYELDLAAGLAFTESDSRLDPLRDAAIETEMVLVVGGPVRLGSRLHIGAFALCPSGSIVLTTKRNLGMFRPGLNSGGPVPPPESS